MASTAEPVRTRSLMRSTLAVAGVRGADFLLSFLVSVLLASRFGAGGQLDAFFLARRTTVGFGDTIRKLVGQIVMPQVVARIDRGEPVSIHGLPRRVHVFLALFLALTLTGTLLPSVLVSAFAPGFTGARHDLTATMMAIMMPLMPIAVIASLLIAALQANRHYVLSEGTNLVQRAILVLVLAVAIPPLGIVAGAWTMLVAGVVGTAILFIGAWPLVRRRPRSLLGRGGDGADEPRDTEADVPSLGGGIAAAIILNLYFQATALIDFAVASTTPEGGVAGLEYGARLVSLVPGLVMSSLHTVMYPELVRAMQDPDPNRAARGLARFQRIGVFVQLPVSVGMMLGAGLMVHILFGRGAFTEASILLAAGTTAGYAAAAIFLTPLSATTAAIYADPRASCLRHITVIAVVGLALRGCLVALAATRWGAIGITWAAAVATALTLAVVLAIAVRRFRHFPMRDQLADFASAALCGGVAAAAGWAWLAFGPLPETVVGRLAMLVTLGIVVVASYAAAAIALRIPEAGEVRALVTKALRRRRGR